MKIWKGIKAIGNAFIELAEPVQIRAARMAAEAAEQHALHNIRQATQSRYDLIKDTQLLPGHGPRSIEGTVYVMQRFDGRAAEPYSVHHLCYKDEMVAVDVAIAWILSKYEERGITNLFKLRDKIGIQHMMGGNNLGGYYKLVVSDDGDYWVDIRPISVI